MESRKQRSEHPREKESSKKETLKSSRSTDAPPGRRGELEGGGAMSMGHKPAKGHNTKNQLPSGSTDDQDQYVLEEGPSTAESNQTRAVNDSDAGPDPEGTINLEMDPQLAPIAEVSLQSHGGQEDRRFHGDRPPAAMGQGSRSPDQESQRGRSPSRGHKKKRRRQSSSTSSYSSSSSASPVRKHRGRRRKHSRRRSHGDDTPLQAGALSQLLSLLTKVAQPGSGVLPDPTAGTVHSHMPTQSVNARRSPSPSCSRSPSRRESTERPQGSPSLDRDSPSRDAGSVRGSPYDSGEAELSGSDQEEDTPLFGTEITREAFEKAVEVLRRHLGFEAPPAEVDPTAKRSKLSLNHPSKDTKASMPVDAECLDRFKATAEARRWTPFPRKQCSAFRLDEKEWKDFFISPRIPVVAVDKLKNAGAMDSKANYKSSTSRKSEKAFSGMDNAARAGMKFSSALLLIAEVLTKSFRQLGEEEVSRKDTGILVNLLGPLSRLIFDQFSRVAVRSVQERRDLVMDALIWPTQDIKRRFLELPLTGPDIFGGQFEDHLQTEVKRQKDLKKADFRTPRSSLSRRRSPDRKRWPRPTARPSGPSFGPAPARRPDRPRSSTSRGTRRPYPTDRHQMSRGAPRGGSRGGAKFQRP